VTSASALSKRRIRTPTGRRHITVTVSGDTATLTGTVGTWLQRDSAERAAANSPGIAHVDNRIVVSPYTTRR
jgi:osmotically-inducible protein OsmY